MRKFKQVTCVVLSLCFVMMGMESISVIHGDVSMETEEVTFEYPITPDDEEWHKLGTVDAKIAACRIPDEILSKMTNEQLYEAVLQFPFLIDLFLAPSIEEGVKSLGRTCDAYKELMGREGAKDFLVEKIKNRSSLDEVKKTYKEVFLNNALVSLVLFQERFSVELSVEEISELVNASTVFGLAESRATNQVNIYTPNGTAVPYVTYTCNCEEGDHELFAEDIVETYDVILIQVGTCIYNCHSYAWFSTSPSNFAWIPDPSVYMSDGSYDEVLNGTMGSSCASLSAGDIVYYGSLLMGGTHSAKMVSNGTGAPITTAYVYSKWGNGGVFKHTVGNVPEVYNTQVVTGWHLAVEE